MEMITARQILSPILRSPAVSPVRNVNGDMPILEVLPRLLDAPDRMLGVTENGSQMGIIDQTSLLEGVGRMIAPRDDSSAIGIECSPEEYSASRIAHAVEDSDAHLVDMFSTPGDDGLLHVTLRVRRGDPSPTVRSLERYGYCVTGAQGAEYQDSEVAFERLLELNTLLNV